ncbi:SMI1/KNR4 family protein [Hyalangium rubrum]|uniref:SMI1/KNR4 family protein n=1 Tax=Hyalangium rubrum TaxID=3103134 RepID=A0ABU5H4Z0_9BACT|nr:SMI1/KNR4 family protein [Hyalangium sp. s54d21]MDY7228563.1 SMI1/KNR4 family protein [Hyalangium sp. s54d21]
MSVSWEPYLREVPPEVAPHHIQALEQRWGITLPAEYKQVVSKHQGMTPTPSLFNIGRGKNVFCVLLTVTHTEQRDSYSVWSGYESLQRYMPPGIYPFGMTSGGEALCFDYRESPSSSQPSIVLVTVEGDLHRIAGSFADFLDNLHD